MILKCSLCINMEITRPDGEDTGASRLLTATVQRDVLAVAIDGGMEGGVMVGLGGRSDSTCSDGRPQKKRRGLFFLIPTILWGDHHDGPPVRLGYLDGALHDERRELGHHQVHALKAGLFQFEDLLFDNGLKGQVRGEEPRPGVDQCVFVAAAERHTHQGE